MELNLELNTVGLSNGQENDYDVIIIGGGPAGATAAIYTARAELKTLVIDKGLTAGAMGITSKIANYPGVLEDISGAELLERMREQTRSFGAVFVQDKVAAVDLLSEKKTIYANGGTYAARAVIIATGSMGRGQRVAGEDRLLGRGVSYCATCDAAFFKNKDFAVVGSSDEAIEEALFLTKFVRQVHFFIATPELKAPSHLIEELKRSPKVNLNLGASLREVAGEEHVEAVRISRRRQGEELIAVSAVFIYLQGGKPITDFVEGQMEISPAGCLIVDREYQTNLPGVFAVGDVLCNHVKQAVIAAAEGAVAAMGVEKQIHGRKQLVVDWAK
jgi:thioredoxin reductase (NADPH)